jgi:hypothetical protein
MKEDIIRMAREAGAKDYGTGEEGVTALMLREEAIERFFNIAQAAEREACAKVCDEVHREYDGEEVSASWIATAIRARGQA